MESSTPESGPKSVLDLPQLTKEQFATALQVAGEDHDDTYAILLKDGSFTFRNGEWDFKTSSLTGDMVAAGYLGKGEVEK